MLFLRDFKPNTPPPGGGHKSKRDVPGPMTDGKRTSNERHIGGDGSRRPSVFVAARRGLCRTPRRTRWRCLSYPRPGGWWWRRTSAGRCWRACVWRKGRPRGAAVRAFGGGGRRVHERVRDHLRGIAAVRWHCLSYPGPSGWWRRRTTAGEWCWRACVQWTRTAGS